MRQGPPQTPPLRSEEKEPTPEKWLNLRKEEVYEKQLKDWGDIQVRFGNEGVQALLMKVVNQGMVKAKREPLPLAVASGASFKAVTSDSASNVAGRSITRGVIVFESLDDFKRFYSAYTGENLDTTSAEGVNLVLSVQMPDSTTEEVSLVIAPLHSEILGHEVRHTIDPYLHVREGYDHVLGELFAYYTEVLEDPRYVNNTEKIWPALLARIWGRENGSYYSHYSADTRTPLSYFEYGSLVKKAVDKMKAIVERNGPLSAQRAVLSSKTMDQFLSLD